MNLESVGQEFSFTIWSPQSVVTLEASFYETDEMGILHFFSSDGKVLCSFKSWDFVRKNEIEEPLS